MAKQWIYISVNDVVGPLGPQKKKGDPLGASAARNRTGRLPPIGISPEEQHVYLVPKVVHRWLSYLTESVPRSVTEPFPWIFVDGTVSQVLQRKEPVSTAANTSGPEGATHLVEAVADPDENEAAVDALYRRKSIVDEIIRHVEKELKEELARRSALEWEQMGSEEATDQVIQPSPARGTPPPERTQSGAPVAERLACLSIITPHTQVLETAARLYQFQLMTFEENFVQQWASKLEQLRTHHEQEMNELLAGTTDEQFDRASSSASAIAGSQPQHGGGGVVVQSTLLRAMVRRQELQLIEALRQRQSEAQESLRKSRSELSKFLQTAAWDVVSGVKAGAEGSFYIPATTSGKGSPLSPGRVDSVLALATIDSFHHSSTPIEVIRVVNPFQARQSHSAQGTRSKDPLVAPIVFGVSPLSSLAHCVSLKPDPSAFDEDGDAAAEKTVQHLRRLGAQRNGAIVFFGHLHQCAEVVEQHNERSVELFLEPTGNDRVIDNTKKLSGLNISEVAPGALEVRSPSDILKDMPEDNSGSASILGGTVGEWTLQDVVEGRRIYRRLCTNMWGGTIQLLVDMSSVVQGPSAARMNRMESNDRLDEGRPDTTARGGDLGSASETNPSDGAGNGNKSGSDSSTGAYSNVFLSIFQMCIASNVDLLSVVLLPQEDRRQRSYLFTPLFHGLVEGIAMCQLALGGARQPLGSFILPLMANGVVKPTDVAIAPPPVERLQGNRTNYNLGMRIRVFTPDKALHVPRTVFGNEAEVLL